MMPRADTNSLRRRSAYHREQTGSLPPRVAAVMDRWQGGETIEQIATALDREPQAVAKVINHWDEGDRRRRAYAAAQRSSAKLAAAIDQFFNFQPRERATAE